MIRHALVILAILLSPMALHAQESSGDENRLSVGGGIGFASSIGNTSAFLLQLDMLYRVTDHLSFGPMFQVAPQSFGSIISMSLDSKYGFDLSHLDDDLLSKLTPYLGAGLGFTHFTGGPGDTGFLISLITGLEYDVSDQVALTSEMRFNIVPGDYFDTFYFSWQMVGVRIRF
jgi:opacity protein-like surface antigen